MSSELQSRLDQLSPAEAWAEYVPSAEQPWNTARVAHLYRRTAWGGSWQQIQEGVELTPRDLISTLVKGSNCPAEAVTCQAQMESFEKDCARLKSSALETGSINDLKWLWAYRMLLSPRPFVEKMTLFWHNHFATSQTKVRNHKLMQRQIETLRAKALGNFGEMLREMTFDPAMILWLDAASNRRGAPNENYAREVMELFSLGVGHYTEKDIQEAARALTGWKVKNDAAVFTKSDFDEGTKTVLGQTGPFKAEEIVQICLTQPACPMWITRKLFRELVSEAVHPSDSLLQPLADGFRAKGLDIGWLVETMVRSQLFFSDLAIHQRVKAPYEFLIGIVRGLEGRVGYPDLVSAADLLGQSLFHPPSVKGWDGGTEWINASTLLKRQNVAFDWTRGQDRMARLDPVRLCDRYKAQSASEIAELFLNIFHQQAEPTVKDSLVEQMELDARKPENAFSAAGRRAAMARTAAHLALTLPEFQLD